MQTICRKLSFCLVITSVCDELNTRAKGGWELLRLFKLSLTFGLKLSCNLSDSHWLYLIKPAGIFLKSRPTTLAWLEVMIVDESWRKLRSWEPTFSYSHPRLARAYNRSTNSWLWKWKYKLILSSDQGHPTTKFSCRCRNVVFTL